MFLNNKKRENIAERSHFISFYQLSISVFRHCFYKESIEEECELSITFLY